MHQQVLNNYEWHVIQWYLCFWSKERHVIYVGCSQLILEKSRMFNSFLSLQNLLSSSGFVKISASWSSVPTLSMDMSPFCWWSLIKWCLTSMCLVLECWTGLFVILIALSLSHSNGTWLKLKPKWLKVDLIHNNCAQQLPALMYLASAVESATLFCFFDDHDTRDLPSNWQVPLVLLLLILHPP